MNEAQSLTVSINPTSTDIEDIEKAIKKTLSKFGFRFAMSGAGPVHEYDLLFRRDLTNRPNSE